jgi:hypothetical protein
MSTKIGKFGFPIDSELHRIARNKSIFESLDRIEKEYPNASPKKQKETNNMLSKIYKAAKKTNDEVDKFLKKKNISLPLDFIRTKNTLEEEIMEVYKLCPKEFISLMKKAQKLKDKQNNKN